MTLKSFLHLQHELYLCPPRSLLSPLLSILSSTSYQARFLPSALRLYHCVCHPMHIDPLEDVCEVDVGAFLLCCEIRSGVMSLDFYRGVYFSLMFYVFFDHIYPESITDSRKTDKLQMHVSHVQRRCCTDFDSWIT